MIRHASNFRSQSIHETYADDARREYVYDFLIGQKYSWDFHQSMRQFLDKVIWIQRRMRVQIDFNKDTLKILIAGYNLEL